MTERLLQVLITDIDIKRISIHTDWLQLLQRWSRCLSVIIKPETFTRLNLNV